MDLHVAKPIQLATLHEALAQVLNAENDADPAWDARGSASFSAFSTCASASCSVASWIGLATCRSMPASRYSLT